MCFHIFIYILYSDNH